MVQSKKSKQTKTKKRNNSKYKDSVFRRIFSYPQYVAEVVRYFTQDENVKCEDLSMVSTDVLLDYSFRKDVAVLYKDKLIIMLEHQSSLNENMPLRYLFYVADYYHSIIKGKKLYQEGRIPLPKPEFIVLYNGKRDQRECFEQKLSESYSDDNGSVSLELKVQWVNVRLGIGSKILEECHALKAYSVFVEQVEKWVEAGYKIEVAIKRAVEYCIKNKYLPEFFMQNVEEVETMYAEEWNLDDALEARYEHGIDIGRSEGIDIGRSEGIDIGRSEGINIGRSEGKAIAVKRIMQKMRMTAEEALDFLEIAIDDRPAVLAALN